MRRRSAFAALSACLVLLPLLASASSLPLAGVGVDESLSGDAVLAEALNAALLRAQGLPVYARIVVGPGELGTPGAFRFDRLDERIERYGLKDVAVVIALGGALPTPELSDPWRQLLRALAERYRGRVKAYEIGAIGSGGPSPSARDYAFVLKLGAVQVRAADPNALVIQGSLRPEDVAWQEMLYGEDLAAYVDAVAITGAREDLAKTLPALEALLTREDPTAEVVVTSLPLPADPSAAARSLLDWQLSHLGSKTVLTTYAASQAGVAKALVAVERVKDLITAELVTLDDQNAGLKLSNAGEDVTGALSHTLLYNVNDFGMYLVYRGAAEQQGALDVELSDATGRKATLRDAIAGRSQLATLSWDSEKHVTHARVPLADRPLLLDFSLGAGAQAARSEVSDKVLPPVSEIVFRHQQVQAAQDDLLQSYMANARMENHFRPSATDPGFDVVTENRFYSAKDGSEWEETAFTLNGTRWGAKRPPFPLLQPEKVLSLPLDLRLSKDYRYRLDGVSRVGEHECYAVRFEPLVAGQSLYSGTVWIDTKSFARVKVQAVQSNLAAPVMSNEEIQYYGPETSAGGQAVTLLSRFTSRQIMLIAGRNILVERIVHFSDFEVNSGDFVERRAQSRLGSNIMYRDTDQGLRYFVKRGDQRVVEEHPTTTAKALAVGVTVDPSYDYPLPIVGINYLNFNFLDKNTQLSLLFGGILALANVQRPKLLGAKVDASLDLFAIAVKSNDQIFGASGEVRGERLRSHPFSTGLNLGYQFSSFQKLIGSYQFRYDGYSRDDGTDTDFKAPVSTVSNGVGLGYEYRRGGYSLVANGTRYRRGSWRSWGRGADFSPDQRSYDKFSVSLSKDLFFKAVHKVHFNAAYFGGRRLDRFSSYQFGFFDDNRIHGVPSSGVRVSDLAMLRAGYSFNLFELYRLDLFVDQGLGRERHDRPWRSITGLGLGVNLRAFFGTLLRAEIGKSFLPDVYKGSGSVVGQLIVLKPL